MCFHSGLGLHLLQGAPISASHRSYIHIHPPGRGLSHGGLVAANGGEDEVNREPRPLSKNQIMSTVPSNCGSGSIVSMHYFSQIRWPVSFLVFSQLHNHVHNHLVQSLYQPISLGVVGHRLLLLNAKDLAQFLNDATGKASTSVTQDPGWGPKDRDLAFI